MHLSKSDWFENIDRIAETQGIKQNVRSKKRVGQALIIVSNQRRLYGSRDKRYVPSGKQELEI